MSKNIKENTTCRRASRMMFDDSDGDSDDDWTVPNWEPSPMSAEDLAGAMANNAAYKAAKDAEQAAAKAAKAATAATAAKSTDETSEFTQLFSTDTEVAPEVAPEVAAVVAGLVGAVEAAADAEVAAEDTAEYANKAAAAKAGAAKAAAAKAADRLRECQEMWNECWVNQPSGGLPSLLLFLTKYEEVLLHKNNKQLYFELEKLVKVANDYCTRMERLAKKLDSEPVGAKQTNEEPALKPPTKRKQAMAFTAAHKAEKEEKKKKSEDDAAKLVAALWGVAGGAK